MKMFLTVLLICFCFICFYLVALHLYIYIKCQRFFIVIQSDWSEEERAWREFVFVLILVIFSTIFTPEFFPSYSDKSNTRCMSQKIKHSTIFLYLIHGIINKFLSSWYKKIDKNAHDMTMSFKISCSIFYMPKKWIGVIWEHKYFRIKKLSMHFFIFVLI